MARSWRLRRGTAAQWTAADPVLGDGELGLATDANEVRVGDGVTAWSALTNRTMVTTAGLDTSVTGLVNDAASALRSAISKHYARVFTPQAYGAVGDGVADDTAAVQAALTAAGAASALGAKTVLVPNGTFKISSPLSVPAGVELRLGAGATISNSVAAQNAVVLNAASVLRGGTIASPASWDGTNVAWTYAVVYVQGDGAVVDGVTLSNVPKVGVGVKDANNVRVSGCLITGNYPSAQWTGVETVHFGITLDPGTADPVGNLVATGNIVRSCVQGVFVGPYGGGGPARGVTIVGNTFEGCWNHGAYVYGAGSVINGNAFNRCQIPVATSGPRMAVIGNTMYTATAGGTDQRDITGISCREAIGCVVADNTITGNAPTGSVIIDIRCTDTVICRDNVVHDNVIDVEGGTSQAIRVGQNATTCENNNVHDNVVRGLGAPNLGLIHMTSAGASTLGLDNRVCNNTLVMEGETHGIYITSQDGCVVSGNKVRLEYDAPAAKTLGMVAVNTSSVRTEVRGNSFKVTAAWGTNVTLRAVYEFTGVTNNVYRDNEYRLDATKLTAAVPLFVQGGSRIHETGAGAPSVAAVVGSTWLRTDGGAATTLYVKESGTTSAGWVGK